MRIRFALALVCAALPALAQSSTATSESQATPPPPPSHVAVDDAPAVEVASPTRAPAAVVATDGIYGGLAGVLVGGGVTLIDQGNHWDRNLMVGAGVGLVAGVAYGIYEVVSAPHPSGLRAAADRNPAESNLGFALPVAGTKF